MFFRSSQLALRVGRHVLRLQCLEDRYCPADPSLADILGPKGLNAVTTGLTGIGVLIGQVETGRTGLRPKELAKFSHPEVKPVAVYLLDKEPIWNEGVGDIAGDHATGVAGLMIADGTTYKGVAPKAGLHSSAYSVGVRADGFPKQADGETADQYKTKVNTWYAQRFALSVTHVAQPKQQEPVRAISITGGIAVEGFPDPVSKFDGTSLLTTAVDYAAREYNTLPVMSAGNAGDRKPAAFPLDSYNSLIVGALTGGDNDRIHEQSWSARADVPGPGGKKRNRISVVAPGHDLPFAETHPTGNASYKTASGTSVAAPLVTGVVALLQEYATGKGADAQQHLVMKAVVMNSADKLKGKAGGAKSIGMSIGFWDASEAADKRSTAATEAARAQEDAERQALPLDMEMGFGAVNAGRAKTQLTEHSTPADVTVKPIAWDYQTVAATNGTTPKDTRYKLPILQGGTYLSAVLAWDRPVALVDKPGGTQNKYDLGESFTPGTLANLDLYLVKAGETDLTKAVWKSNSTDYNVETIFFGLDAKDEAYDLVVRQNNTTSTPYALAWWSEVPKPKDPMSDPKKMQGTVWNDQNGDGIRGTTELALHGVRVDLYDAVTDELLDSRDTDPEGEYEFTVDGQYYANVELPDGHTFSPPNVSGNTFDTVDSDVNATGRSHTLTGSSTTQDWIVDAGIHLTPGTATLGDRVWLDANGNGVQDIGETGVGGVEVTLKDEAGAVVGSTTTGTDGSWGFSDVDAGDYSIEFESPTGYEFSTGGPVRYVSVFAGDAITDIDAGLYQAATVGGLVWDDVDGDGIRESGEAVAEGVSVNLYREFGELLDTTLTDEDGAYTFADLTPGEYSVAFSDWGGSSLTKQNQGTDYTLDSDADRATGFTAPFTLMSGQALTHIDAGLTENTPPTPTADTATTDEDTPVTINVLANDTDPDADPLVVTDFTAGGHGTVTAGPNPGEFVYTPDANWHGTDWFTYGVDDGFGGVVYATVTVVVTPVNDPPVATDDMATTAPDTPVTIPVQASDPDGDALTVTAVTQGTHGTVTFTATGVTYTPDAGFTGTDSFTYTVSDGHGGTATGLFVVLVSAVITTNAALTSAAVQTFAVGSNGSVATNFLGYGSGQSIPAGTDWWAITPSGLITVAADWFGNGSAGEWLWVYDPMTGWRLRRTSDFSLAS